MRILLDLSFQGVERDPAKCFDRVLRKRCEQFWEQARIIYDVSPPEFPHVGILSSRPVEHPHFRYKWYHDNIIDEQVSLCTKQQL